MECNSDICFSVTGNIFPIHFGHRDFFVKVHEPNKPLQMIELNQIEKMMVQYIIDYV